MKALHERNRSEPASRLRYAVRTRQRHQGGGAAGADPIRRQPCARPVAAIDRRPIVRARAGRVAPHRAFDGNRTGRSGGAVALVDRDVDVRVRSVNHLPPLPVFALILSLRFFYSPAVRARAADSSPSFVSYPTAP